MRLFITAAAALASISAHAQEVDCGKLKTTQIPFQITLEEKAFKDLDDTGTPTFTRKQILQITRDKGRAVSVFALEGLLGSTSSIYGIIQSNRTWAPNGERLLNTTISYETPISNQLGTGRSFTISYHSKMTLRGQNLPKNNSLKNGETTYTFLRDDNLVVEPCHFNFKVYRVTSEQQEPKVELESTLFYSPELTFF